jgi:hypothetical protein
MVLLGDIAMALCLRMPVCAARSTTIEIRRRVFFLFLAAGCVLYSLNRNPPGARRAKRERKCRSANLLQCGVIHSELSS